MKNIDKVLVKAAALVTLIGIISRVTLIPVAGIPSRAIVGFAALLLLFAIALKDSK